MCNLKKKREIKLYFPKKKKINIERLLHKRKRFLDKFFSFLKEPYLSLSLTSTEDHLFFSFAFQSYRKIARQVSTPDSAPAGLGSPQTGIGGLQQHQQQPQQQSQQTLHQPDPMQQSKDNLNPAANQQTGALRNGNPPPPVVSIVSTVPNFLLTTFTTFPRQWCLFRIPRVERAFLESFHRIYDVVLSR